jgi:transposase
MDPLMPKPLARSWPREWPVREVLNAIFSAHVAALVPFIAKAFADIAGDGPSTATTIPVEIVRKPADQIDFAVHRRRWVVKRFFAWIGRKRRLWKDPEATLASGLPLRGLQHAPNPPPSPVLLMFGPEY